MEEFEYYLYVRVTASCFNGQTSKYHLLNTTKKYFFILSQLNAGQADFLQGYSRDPGSFRIAMMLSSNSLFLASQERDWLITKCLGPRETHLLYHISIGQYWF